MNRSKLSDVALITYSAADSLLMLGLSLAKDPASKSRNDARDE